MDKIGMMKKNTRGRNNALALILALALIMTAIIPSGVSASENMPATGVGSEGTMNPDNVQDNTGTADPSATEPETDPTGEDPTGAPKIPDEDPEEEALPPESPSTINGLEGEEETQQSPPGEEQPPTDTGIKPNAPATVRSWEELITQMGNASVDVITLDADVIRPNTNQNMDLPQISRNLEINGKGLDGTIHTIAFHPAGTSPTINKAGFTLAQNVNATFYLHDVHIARNNTTAKSLIGTASNTGGTDTYDHSVFSTAHGNASQNWNVRIGNLDTAPAGLNEVPASGLVALQDGAVTFEGRVDWKMPPSASIIVVNARNIKFAGGSEVSLAGGANGSSEVPNPTIRATSSNASRENRITAEDGAKVDVYGANGPALFTSDVVMGFAELLSPPVTPIAGKSHSYLDIKGAGTDVYFYGDGGDWGDDGGVVAITGGTGGINVEDQAHLRMENRRLTNGGPAMIVKMPASVFSVKGEGSQLKLDSYSGSGYMSATLRFRAVGNQTFDISDKGRVDITNHAHFGQTYNPATIRFGMGSGNTFKCRSGGVANIINEGNGTADDGDGNVVMTVPINIKGGGNDGIEYLANNYTFDLSGQGSRVTIRADFGPGIDASGRANGVIRVADGAVFDVVGNTASASAGVFRAAAPLQFTSDRPLYYDFDNRRSGGGRVISLSGNTGNVFQSNNTDVSVWRSGIDDLNGNPYKSWTNVTYGLSGQNFSVHDAGNPEPFKSEFGTGGLSTYARISGNNATVKVTELLQPENADKHIRALAFLPEGGLPTGTPIWDDYAWGRFEITPIGGGQPYTVNAKALRTETVYEQEIKKDTLEGVLIWDSADFLKTGDKVRLIKVWRGSSDDQDTANVRVSNPDEDFSADAKLTKTVTDTSPPLPGSITTSILYANQRNLTGTWAAGPAHNADTPVSVIAYDAANASSQGTVIKNGATTVTGTINFTNNTWSYTIPAAYNLQAGHVLRLVLVDAAGNEVPWQATNHHDATFAAAPTITVSAVAYMITAEDAYIGTAQAILLDPRNEDTFISVNAVKGIDLSKEEGQQDTPVEVESISPAWDQGWLTWNARPPEITKIYDVTYRVVANPSTKITVKITVYNSMYIEHVEGYLIGASDIPRMSTTKAASITDAQLITEARAWAKHATNSALNATVEVQPGSKTFPQDGRTAGVGKVTFQVREKPAANTAVNVTVGNGNPPILDVVKPIYLNFGASYHNGMSVSAIDTEDGPLTWKIISSGAVDTAKAGGYQIHYSVTDSDYNTVTTDRGVFVGMDGGRLYAEDFIISDAAVVETPSATKNAQLRTMAKAAWWNIYGATGSVNDIRVLSDGGYRHLRDSDNGYAEFVIRFDVPSDPDIPVKEIKARVTTFQNGGPYYITYQNPTIRIADAQQNSDAKALDWTDARGFFREANGSLTDITRFIEVYRNTIQAVKGTYDVVLRIVEAGVVKKEATAKVTVAEGYPPTLTTSAITVNVPLSGSFTPLDNVYAWDDVDGNITNKITWAGIVNVNQKGYYPVLYSVTDSDGNTTRLTRNIWVGIDGGPYYVVGADFYIGTADVITGNAAQILEKSGAKVYDESHNLTDGAFAYVADDNGYRQLDGNSELQKVFNIKLGAKYKGTNNVVNKSGTSDPVSDSIKATVVGEIQGGYVLNAKNFTIPKADVTQNSSGAAIAWAGAQAYHIDAPQTPLRVGVDINEIVDAEGDYRVRFFIDENPKTATPDNPNPINPRTVKKEVTAHVAGGGVPTLNAPGPYNLPLGNPYDPWTNVTSNDAEDGNMILPVNKVVLNGGAGTNVDINVPGIYVDSYYVEDSARNSASAKRVVVVNDGAYSVGSEFIVRAKSFVIRKADADGSSASASEDQIRLKAGVQAWSGLTGAEVTASILERGGYYDNTGTWFSIKVGAAGEQASTPDDKKAIRNIKARVVAKDVIVQGNGYIIGADNFRINSQDENGALWSEFITRANTQVWRANDLLEELTPNTDHADVFYYAGRRDGTKGVYDLTLQARSETSTKATVKVSVSDGSAPIITVTSPIFISKGGVFNIAEGVSAADAEDDAAHKPLVIVSSGAVDVNTAGVYTVTYSVTDSDYLTDTKSRVVIVDDGSIRYKNNYVLQARNYVILQKNVNGSDDEIKSRARARAWRVTPTQGAFIANETIYVTSKPTGYRAGAAEGDYAITITVRYQDGVTTKDGPVRNITAKVIKADNIGEDDDYVIVADDISKTLSVMQSELSNAKLLEWADARAWTKIDLQTTTVRNGPHNVQAAIGSYTAEYQVQARPAVNTSGRVDVTSGTPPAITIDPNPHEVSKVSSGSTATYNYMEGVTAWDPNDGNLTSSITRTGTVDLKTEGVYVVTYSVTDADDNTDTKKRVVVVNDGTFVVTPTYILRARSFVIKGNEVAVTTSDRETQILTKAKARAWKTDDGTPSDARVFSMSGYGPNEGVYDLVIVADNDTTVRRAIRARVVNDETVVDAGEYWIVGNPILMNTTVDKTRPNLVTLGKVRAYKADDQLSAKDAGLEAYTGSYNGTEGTFKATFHVVENTDNKLVLDVVVSDRSKPTLTVDPNPLFLQVNGAFSYGMGVTARDIEDDAAGKPLVVVSSGAVDTSREGVYIVKYSVTDSDYNKVEVDRTVHVGGTVIGPYVLYADNFAIQSANVVATPQTARDNQIKDASLSKLVDLTTGAIIADGRSRIEVRNATGYTQLAITEPAKSVPIRLGVQNYATPPHNEKGIIALITHKPPNPGDKYLIDAHDISLTIGEAKNITDAQLIASTHAVSFSMETFLPGGTVKVTQPHGVKAQVGDYPVNFYVDEEPTTSVPAIVNVYNTIPPEIRVPSPSEVQVGGSIDLMQGVRATEAGITDITNKVTYSPTTIDTSKHGVYVVSYEVKDGNDQVATAKRVVVVNDGTYAVGSKYIVKAKSFVIRKSQADPVNSADQILDKAGVKAWDAVEGNTTNPIILNRGGYYDGSGTLFSISIGAAMDAGTMPASERAIRNIRARVVDSDVIVEGTKYIIGASNRRLNSKEETGVTNAQLINYTTATAWKWDDTLDLAPVEVSLYNGNRNGTPGNYDLTVRVQQEPATIATVKVLVNDGDSPVLTVFTPMDINLGASFDYRTSVSAIDTEDQDITHLVTWSGVVNTSQKGVYKVLYSVTDSDFNTVTETRLVGVGLVGGTNYWVDAENFVTLTKDVNVGTTAARDADILLKSKAKAWSKATGEEVPNLRIVKAAGGYQAAAGDYNITIGAQGDAAAEIAVKAKVVDGDVIDFDAEYVIVASHVKKNIGEMNGYVQSVLLTWAKVEAWNLSDMSTVSARVGANNVTAAVGKYTADYEVTARPAVKVTGNVNVETGTPPVITGTAIVEVALNSGPFNYMSGITVTDAEDDAASPPIPVRVTTSGAVDTTKDGVYLVRYNATDSDGNPAKEFTRVVVVNDGNYVVTPEYILRAHSFVIKGNEVALSAASRTTQILDKSEAKAWNAKTAAEVEAEVVNNGNYSSTKNVYPITVAVKADSRVYRNINAEVVDDSIVIEVGDYYIIGNPIKMNTTTDKTHPDLIQLGNVRAKKKDTNLTAGTVDLDSYTGNFDGTAGTFKATFSVRQQPSSKLTIDVMVTDGLKPVITAPAIDIPLDGTFDYMDGVVAHDFEDGPLTSKVTYTGTVNTKEAGVYTVTYSVSDKDYNTTTKDRKVYVGGVMGDIYVLFADDFGMESDNLIESPDAAKNQQILSASNAKAYFKDTGVLDPNAPLRVRSDGGYRKLQASEDYKIFPVNIDIATDLKANKNINALVGWIIGGKAYWLFLKNFDITVAQAASHTNNDLINWAGATALRKGDLVPGTIEVSSSAIRPTKGAFDVVYRVRETMSAPYTEVDYGTAVANVDSKNPPYINAPTPAEVALGATFNPMQNVTATDPEDGIITTKVAITSNNVDTSKAGVYIVTYRVEDKDFNVATAKRVVVVNDGTYSVGTRYIVRANSFIIKKAEADPVNSDDQIFDRAGIKAWSGVTGDEVTASILDNGNYYDGVITQAAIQVGVALDSGTVAPDKKAIRDIKALVVEKDVLEFGAGYAIGANNFRINPVDETGVTNAELLVRASAQAWRLTDNLPETTPEVSLYTGKRNGDPGLWDLTVRVVAEINTQATVKVNVSNIQPPVLDVTTPFYVSLGGVYDYMTSVSAVSGKDGNITHKVTYSGVVDTGKEGVYPVEYSVTDSEYNTEYKTRVVVVGDITEGDKYLIQSKNFVALKKDVKGTDAEILTNSETTIWDKFTGLVVSGVARVLDNGGYEAKVDDYDIQIGAQGDAKAVRNIKAKVVDGDVIEDDGEYIIVASHVNITISVAVAQYNHANLLIWANVQAFKKSDLSATAYRVGTNNVNPNVVGGYQATYEVTAKPATNITANVNITRGEIPVITVTPSPIEVPRDSVFDYMTGVTAHDDEQGDITSDVTHTGTVNTSVAGVYKVTYNVSDVDGNDAVPVTRVVVVNDGNYVVTPVYILHANSFVIKGADVAPTAISRNAQIMSEAAVKAWDSKTADEVPADVINDGGYKNVKGVYPITAAVRNDSRVKRDIQAEVVDDTIVIKQGDYYLIGNPIKLNPEQDKASNQAALITLGGVRVKKMDDRLTAGTAVVESYNGKFDGAEGTYQAVFHVKEQTTSKLTLPVVVDKGGLPILDVTTPYVVQLGGVYDYADGVTVRDVEDEAKGIPLVIVSSGAVDVNKKGSYEVTYSVTDSDYNTVTKKRIVAVGGIPGDIYILYADDFIITSSAVDDSSTAAKHAQILEKSGAYAEYLDGTPAPMAPIRVRNDGGYRKLTEDEYAIPFKVDLDIATDTKAQTDIAAVVAHQFNVGGEYILTWKDFSISVNEARNNSDAQAKAWAKAKAFHKWDMVEADVIVDKNDIIAQEGIYDVTFSVRPEPTTTGTAKATVRKGAGPTLNVTTPSEVPLNGTFDPMQNVTATDPEDGDITTKVAITSNNVNTSVAGIYTVNYSVVDKDDNPATAKRIVVVNDGTFSVGSKYIVRATSFVIRKAEAVTGAAAGEDQIRDKAGIKAWNGQTGDEVTAVILERGGYYDGTGTDFSIRVGVGDDVNTQPVTARAIRNIKAKVVAKDIIVTGPKYIIGADNFKINRTEETGISNDQLLSRSHTEVWEKTDTLTPSTAQVFQYMGLRNGTPGLYDLIVNAALDAGTRATVKVNVTDGQPPVLTVYTPMKISVGAIFDPMISVSAIDAEEDDITSRVTCAGVVDTSKEGVYTVLYSVTDSDFNTETATRVVAVGDLDEGDKYFIAAKNFVILLKDVQGTDAEILGRADAKAWDKFTGAPANDKLEVRDDDGYKASKQVGDYGIVIGAEADAKARKDVTGKIFDGDIIDDDGEYIIAASNVTVQLGVAMAEYTPAKLLEWAKAKAWKKADLSETAVEVGTNDVDKDVVGNYHADYQVVAKKAVKVNGEVNVITGEEPVLTVTPNPHDIPLGSGAYNYNEGVSVTDKEDDAALPAIPVKITTSGAVDTTKVGVYKVQYVAEDSDGNKDTVTRIVVVNDGTILVTPTYILKAASFVIKGNDVATTVTARTTQLLDKTGAYAWDSKTGDPTPAIILADGGYGPNQNDYNIDVAVGADRNVSKQVIAMVVNDSIVIDEKDYFIVGNPILMNTTVDKATTMGGLIDLGKVKAYEKGVGLTPSAVATETYTGNFDGTPGQYKATFGVIAKPANKLVDLPVQVNDRTNPVLTVETPIHVPLHGTYSYAMGVSATDVEDNLAGIPLTIVSSGAVDVDNKGFYKVTYSVTDSDYNTVSKQRLVVVGDYVIGDKYILDAVDFAILSKNVDDSSTPAKHAQIRGASKSQAWDLEGDPAPGANIRVANDGGYSKTESLYNIRIDIVDDLKAARDIVARVLDGDILVEGPDYIITAKNFTLNVDESRTLSDDKLIELAKARAFDKNNKFAPAAKVVVDKSNIQPKKGAYDVVYSVREEPATKATIKATIVGGNPPVLTVPTPAEIPLGGSYNPMTNVRAMDIEDGDLTAKVQVKSTVNPNVAGVYIDVYTVQDKDDNVATVNRVVVVNDGTYSVGSNYILQASSFVIKKSEAVTVNSEDQIIERSKAKAWNAISGDRVSPTVFVNGGYYDGVREVFSIRLGINADQFTIPESNRAIRNITARVIDREIIVETPEYIIAANNVKLNKAEENGVSNAQLIARAGAVAYNVNEGLEPVPVNVEAYTGTRLGIKGLFDLTFNLTVSATTRATVKVAVTDGAVPTISATTPIEIAKGATFDYLAGVSASDAEDGNITNRVTYTQTVNPNEAGVYAVIYSVTDSDYNTATFTRIVVVNDGAIHIGTEYIVQAKNFVSLAKDVTGSDLEILSKAEAKVWKKTDGVLTPDQAVVQSNGNYRNVAGDYSIRIAAAGDASATVTVTGRVVEDEIIQPDDEYTIVANPVVMPLADAQADLSNAKLIALAKARAFNKTTMQDVAVRVRTSTAVPAVGLYDVIYEVVNKPQVAIASTVQITSGNAPKLDVNPNPHTVQMGSGPYAYMTGVTASDTEDGNLTNSVTYSGVVNTSVAGLYQVNYSVRDNNNNTTREKRTVIVNDGTYIITPTYALHAESFVVKGSEVPASATERAQQIMTKASARAFRIDTGQQVDAIIMTNGNYGSKAGSYNITIAVDANRGVSRQIKALVVEDSTVVKDGDYYIVGNAIKMTTSVDRTSPNLVGLGNVRAYRNDDNMTQSQVTLESYNGKHNGTPGNYNATFSVNAEPARKLENLPVMVWDGSKPNLEITTPVVIPINSAWDPLVGARASDFEDDLAGIPLVIKSSGTVNTAVEGLYKLTYSVTDSDYNTVTKTRLVAVGDFILGDGYLLMANGFTDSVMNINGGQSEILSRTGARAWDSNGNPLTAAVKSDGGYRKVGGSYQIVIGVSGKDGVPSKTILANITAFTFTVLFNSNGADAFAGPWVKQVVQPGNRIDTLPVQPTRTGYTFNGWNTAQNGGGSGFNGNSNVINDVTVYAQWLVNSYTLSFNANGGSGKVASAQTVQYNALATAVTKPTDATKDFIGWNTRADGTGTGWSFAESRMPARNVTLYAQWKTPVKETVTVDKPVIVEKEVTKVVQGPTRTNTVTNTITRENTTSRPVYVPTGQAIQVVTVPAVETPVISEPAIPTTDPPVQEGSWSLLNLLLVLIGFALVIFGLAAMVLRRRSEDRWGRVKNIIGAVVAVVAAIVNVVVFMLTQEGFDTSMQLADKYTIINALIFLIMVVGIIAALRTVQYESEEEDTY